MFIIRLLAETTNAIVFWQSEGARYVRAMCLFFIFNVTNKHVEIPNIHISMLVTSLAGYVGNLLSTLCSKLTFTYYLNYN